MNINDFCWVRLNAEGVRSWTYRWREKMGAAFADRWPETNVPKPGEWFKVQFYEFMERFGPTIRIWSPTTLIENRIEFSDPDVKP